MDFEFVEELENVLINFEALRDLLAMLSDCALEGTASLDNYKSGISFISTLANNNTDKLQVLLDKVYPTEKKGA